MPTRVILIRHGETIWNKQKRYCGCRDIDLSNVGRLQALRLREKLRNLRFDKIYCSDRKRALTTAKIIFGKTKIIKEKKLREMSFGVIEGLRHKEIMDSYADIYKRWLKDPYNNYIPKAEKLNLFKKRVTGVIKKIVSHNGGKTVCLVCHGGTISIFIAGILKSRNFWRYIPGSASISILEYWKNGPKIKMFNEIAHLKVNRWGK